MNQKMIFAISVICIVATAFLVLLSGMIPVLSVPFMLISSVFSAYCFIKCGVISTLANILISLIIALFMGEFQIYILVIPALGIFPGIISGVLFKKKTEFYFRIFGVFLSFLLMYTLTIYTSAVSIGVGIGEIFDSMGASARFALEGLLTEGANIEKGELISIIDLAIIFSKMVFPSILIIVSMLIGYIHIVLFDVVIRKSHMDNIEYIKFDSHCAPRSMSYVYFISTILLLFSTDNGTFTVVLNNIVMILDTLLAFCGLSFVESKFKNVLKVNFFRWMIYIFAILFSGNFALQILSIIGMLDSFANYRKIRRIGE